MIIFRIVLGVLLAALLAAGFYALDFACVRHKQLDMRLPENLQASRFKAMAPEILAGVGWLDAQPWKPLQVMSYDGKRLFARFVPCENAKGTILLFHGYRSSYVIDFGISLSFYHSLGFNLLICDQRSHGQSEGRYITFGVRERFDVLSWVTYLSQMLGQAHPLYLGGLSMGATTVLLSACFEFPGNVRGIIADCGFTSPQEIMLAVIKARQKHVPTSFLLWFVNLFTTIFAGFSLKETSTVDTLAESRYPVLFIHGTGDGFVPSRMSQAGYDACVSPKKLVLVEGADHGLSYIVDRPRVQTEIRSFVEANLPKEDAT